VHDTLHEAMDIDGLQALVARIRGGGIGLHAVDRAAPSPFAEAILHAKPYAFLDDAPLEERRTHAVAAAQRGARATAQAGDGDLDAAALAAVARECWPEPRSAAELHEALGWIGWLAADEALPAWTPWLHELAADGRAVRDGARWYAGDASRDLLAGWRGRLEAVLPVWDDGLDDAARQALLTLQAEGVAMQARCGGRTLWAHRRLLARVRTRTLETLRQAIEPVSQADYAAFLRRWQHEAPGCQQSGPAGLATVLTQLAGDAHPADAWEDDVLPTRLDQYRREWLDHATLGGEFVWLRLWGPWRGPLGRCPISVVPRRELPLWLELPLERAAVADLGAAARTLFDLLQQRGAVFPTDLQAHSRLLPSMVEDGLAELVGHGLATCDSFAALRQLAVPPSRRAFPLYAVGRWSLLPLPPQGQRASEAAIEFAAQALLRRYGVVSHARLLADRAPIPWRLVLRALRGMELRGEVRGGRFVNGEGGEQYARTEAVTALRRVRDGRRELPGGKRLG
jgi:ATP-dependent Lhr-like helicase